MRKLIPFMELMKGVSFIFGIHIPKPEVFCKLFKDNQILLLSWSLKNSHQEKHISIKYHNFRSFVQNNSIRMRYIDTQE